ncbi:cytidylyltransferase domain-containing protein, partial [Thermoproteota archaeon]
MYKEKKIIAIIPARGGSKGIPKKNIIDLAGKPLIAHTIESGKKSKHIDMIVVSTDDKEIEEVSKKYGVEVIQRPEEFAQDSSPTIDVIKHVIDVFEKQDEHFDIVVLLEPTSPLRKDDDIDKAIEVFVDNPDAESLVSLGEIALESPFIAKVVDNGFVIPLIKTDAKIYQRQQLQKTYFPYGVVYMSKTKPLLETGTFYQEKTTYYLIERWQNYE